MIHDIQREDGIFALALTAQDDKSVCNIKSGVNDFLDYLGILVTIVIPTLIGKFTRNCFTPTWCQECKLISIVAKLQTCH